MLDLTASRALASSARRRLDLGLDAVTVDRAVAALCDALSGWVRLTRAEALAAVSGAGVSVAGQAGYHVLTYAAQVGAISIGPQSGSHQT